MTEKKAIKPRRIYEEPEEIVTLIPVSDLPEWIEKRACELKEFKPSVCYNRDGDLIEVYFENDHCVAESQPGLTIERSMETQRVVGVKVHGVKKLMGLKEIAPKACRMFPIQSQHGAEPHPLSIPWAIAELAYSAYAAYYGRNQSLECLAERGGFSPCEMDLLLPGWRGRCDENEKLREALRDIGRIVHVMRLDQTCKEAQVIEIQQIINGVQL